MATGAAICADDVANPFALASHGCSNSISVLAGSWKLVSSRQFQQRVPILRRIILRSSAGCGSDHGRQIQLLAGRRLHLG